MGLAKRMHRVAGGLLLLAVCGCGPLASPVGYGAPPPALAARAATPSNQTVSHSTPDAAPGADLIPSVLPIQALEVVAPLAPPAQVDEFVKIAVQQNPRLAKARFAIDAAQGRYIQAGLYPNPDLSANWDEIGDRTGPGGILTLPKISQPLVTGHKLSLAQKVVATEVDRSALAVMTERFSVIGTVRADFYDTFALQKRIEILTHLVQIADEAVKIGTTLLENKQIARLDLLTLEVERERFRADAEAAERELPAARRKLAAAVGDPRLPVGVIGGDFETLPLYDANETQKVVLASHPEVRSAKLGVERAQAALNRAQAEPIPNVSVYSGYVRQYEFKSNDFTVGFSTSIPVWNRNQGNIRAAQAEVGVAQQEVGRVENDLADRVATAFRVYASSRERAERYRADILPRANESYELSVRAFKGGQFEYLRVIQAQRAVAEARLEYNRSLGQAWKAAAELSGLLLQEAWPGPEAKK